MPLVVTCSDGEDRPGVTAKSDCLCCWPRLDRPSIGRVLVQRIMNAILLVIADVITDQTAEVFFIQRDDMVKELASTASYPSFGRSVCGTAEMGSGQRSRRANGGQCPWPVEVGEQPGTCHCAAQCLLRLARDSEIDWRPIAQPADPPGTDPYAGWCNRESGRPPTYVYCRVARLEAVATQPPGC
jgi:hypothetical protein